MQVLLNRRPIWVPKAVWKFALRARALTAFVAYATLAIWIGWLGSQLASVRGTVGMFDDPLVGVAAGVMLLVSATTLSAWWRSVTRRHTRILRANSYLMCIECGYLLNGLPDGHACPECGTAYVFETRRRRWEDWLGEVGING